MRQGVALEAKCNIHRNKLIKKVKGYQLETSIQTTNSNCEKKKLNEKETKHQLVDVMEIIKPTLNQTLHHSQ